MWLDRQDHGSLRGVAIGAWRSYQAVDGPLQTALLSLYMLVAVLPALLVFEEALESNASALADTLVRHLALSATTAGVLRGVLVENKAHELGSALFAIASALFFGLGFGRVLQLVHVRAWKLNLEPTGADKLRYGVVLVSVYAFVAVLLVQLNHFGGEAEWVRLTTAVGWFGLLVLFFVWAPGLLTHKLVAARDLLPSAVLTAVGLVVLVIVSRFGMEAWVDLYAKDYGGLGAVMAIFFWLSALAGIVVGSAALAPPLAERRALRAAR
jgi:membrane protein